MNQALYLKSIFAKVSSRQAASRRQYSSTTRRSNAVAEIKFFRYKNCYGVISLCSQRTILSAAKGGNRIGSVLLYCLQPAAWYPFFLNFRYILTI